MNFIVDFFPEILNFAKSYGLPLTKKRGILREYLQTKILEIIYRQKKSNQIYFIGGTSLRLLHGLDRFSEDLDFDMGKITLSEVSKIMKLLISQLKREGFLVELYSNQTKKRNYYELKFSDLLFKLGISRNKSEKLIVKLDFEQFWQGEKREIILLKRYGFLVRVTTINLNQLLVQKLFAYLNRKQTQPRDIYDIVWLFARKASLDLKFVKKNNIVDGLVVKAIIKFKREEKKLSAYKRKLKPFLIDERNTDKLNFFLDLTF